MTDTAKLLHFGRGGDTMHLTRHSKIEGHGSPERPHACTPGPDRVIPVGTPVVDVREAVLAEPGFKWVFRGPLVDVDATKRVNWAKVHGLSDVPIDQFIEGWRAHGARIGTVASADPETGELVITWEDEQTQTWQVPTQRGLI